MITGLFVLGVLGGGGGFVRGGGGGLGFFFFCGLDRPLFEPTAGIWWRLRSIAVSVG